MIIRTKKKNTICIPYQQGKLFQRFEEEKSFVNLVKELKVHKTTMIFRINVYLEDNCCLISLTMQDKLFCRFEDKGKFVNLVKELKVHKATMIFKINIYLEDHCCFVNF